MSARADEYTVCRCLWQMCTRDEEYKQWNEPYNHSHEQQAKNYRNIRTKNLRIFVHIDCELFMRFSHSECEQNVQFENWASIIPVDSPHFHADQDNYSVWGKQARRSITTHLTLILHVPFQHKHRLYALPSTAQQYERGWHLSKPAYTMSGRVRMMDVVVATLPPQWNKQRNTSQTTTSNIKSKSDSKINTCALLHTWTRKSVHRLLPLERMRTPVPKFEYINIYILGGRLVSWCDAGIHGTRVIDAKYFLKSNRLL